MREDYVRPPLIAQEARSQTAAVWRYRIVVILIMLVVLVLAGWLILKITGFGSEDPGFGGALPALSSWAG